MTGTSSAFRQTARAAALQRICPSLHTAVTTLCAGRAAASAKKLRPRFHVAHLVRSRARGSTDTKPRHAHQFVERGTRKPCGELRGSDGTRAAGAGRMTTNTKRPSEAWTVPLHVVMWTVLTVGFIMTMVVLLMH
jgi:hypothetical protein